MVYVVCVPAALARVIVGMGASASMRTDVALDALEQALYDREVDAGLVHQCGVSNCLESQVEGSTSGVACAVQGCVVRTITLRMVSSFRMQATSASFFGLPAANKRT